MATAIRIRRGTTLQWNSTNRVLQQGELGLDTTLNKLKVGNNSSLWSGLPFLNVLPSEVNELCQDAVFASLDHELHTNITVTHNDNSNQIVLSTGPDVVTFSSLNNTLTDPSSGYVPIGDVGNPDGVASLDSNGFIPDSEIPSNIARDTEIITSYNDLSDKPTIISSYNDLSDKPTIISSYTELSGTPDLTLYAEKESPVFTGKVTVDDIEIDGDIIFNGTATEINSTSLTITDPLIYLGESNPANTVDLGFVSSFNDGIYQHSGLVRDATDNKWKLFKGVVDEPTNTVNFAQATYDSLSVGPLEATSINVSGSVTGIDKSDVGLSNVDDTSDEDKPVSTETQNALDAKADSLITLNSKSSNYTLATSDLNKMIEMSGGGTLTISDSSSFQVGFSVDILQTGSSQVTVAGNGFTPNATPGLKLRAQWSSATLLKRGLNSWVVFGDLSA
jgi:hypothetical protein